MRCDTKASPVAYYEITDADVVLAGQTFLFYNGATTNITVTTSGAVKQFEATPSFTITRKKNQFIAYPWPVDLKISDMAKFYTGKSSGSFGAAGDQIWRWDVLQNTWVKYCFRKASGAAVATWQRCNTKASPVEYFALTDDDKIPAGQGFLFYNGATSDVTINFVYPIPSGE